MSEDHPLTPLLAPRNIAFLGASASEDTFGRGMMVAIREAGFEGAVYAVNPKYEEVLGYPCFPSLADVPEPVDLAVLAVKSARLEGVLAEAIEHGARAATIFDSCYLEGDRDPPLADRLGAMAREAGMPICGGNCMGYNNLDSKCFVTGYPTPYRPAHGGIAFITHSGTAYGSIPQADPRLGFNMVISSGREMATTMADYMHYALAQDTTRVIALFLETVRDPEGFVAALERARERSVPVVVLKVGRTEVSARMAATHSGAIAGNDAAYQAVFERYGVVRVTDLYEMASSLALLSGERQPGPGGLAVVGDSGGERGMLVDLAADLDVPFADIGSETRAKLRARLSPELEPVNPTDAWGTRHDYVGVFRDCYHALLDDPDTAIAVMLRDLRTGEELSENMTRVVADTLQRTEKPVALATNFSGVSHRDIVLKAVAAGVPVLDGTRQMLRAVKHAFEYRDFRARPAELAPAPPAGAAARWRAELSAGGAMDEARSLALLSDFGVPTLPHRVVEDLAEALAAAGELGYPAALKTAMPGVLHKSDLGGVKLGLADADALADAYDDLAARLGPRTLVAPMAGRGVELAFGMIQDAQFGPLVVVGAGGVLIELLRDRAFALPPFGAATARRLVDSLAIRPLLDGARGAPPADIDALAHALSCFSVMAAELSEHLGEVDANPVIAGPDGIVALDGLVVPRSGMVGIVAHG